MTDIVTELRVEWDTKVSVDEPQAPLEYVKTAHLTLYIHS